jgi:hypothetical protein
MQYVKNDTISGAYYFVIFNKLICDISLMFWKHSSSRHEKNSGIFFAWNILSTNDQKLCIGTEVNVNENSDSNFMGEETKWCMNS